MRAHASILHLDLDAFFASVEQRDKPSLRGKPVIVGGLGQRGVVSTASYEARPYGVHSAMPMHEARRLCPHAAFLAGRFGAYRQASQTVRDILTRVSAVIEPLSLDEAFLDLAAAPDELDFSDRGLRELAAAIKAEVAEHTGGLTCSIGLGSSKFIAKLATELGKPDGIHLISPGTEVDTIAPMSVRVIPGVGPATFDKLSRLGVESVADVHQLKERELVRELGRAAGNAVWAFAHARDDRPVEADREAKSISVEDTFETDLIERDDMVARIARDAQLVSQRVRASGVFARTVTLKVRLHDFTTFSRSRTLVGATDSAEVIAAEATEMLDGLDLAHQEGFLPSAGHGVRLLGVGVSGLTTVAQDSLFDTNMSMYSSDDIVADSSGSTTVDRTPPTPLPADEPAPSLPYGSGTVADARMGAGEAQRIMRRPPRWVPGADVVHDQMGPGWIWGTGLGRVTVRFETAETGPGPVRTYWLDDPALRLI